MKEPKIRFKGFQGEWVEKALKEVAPLQRGFDLPSHSICTGLIPIAYSNGVLNYHNIGKCYAPGLVTGRSGTIGKFTFIESGMYWPHNTSLWVTNFFNNVPKYIYYMYHTIGIEKYSTGSGVPTLNRNDVHDIIIYCPSIAEQQSIADYFTNLDTLIQSTTKKIESLKQVKAASLQSMFPQEGETTPRVRFKGFEGEWEEKRLGDIAERYDNLRIPIKESFRVKGLTPYYGANGIQDYVDGYTHDGEYVLVAEDGANDLNNYPVIYVVGKIWVNNHAHVLQAIKNYSTAFLKFRLQYSNIKSVIVGGSRAKLNAAQLMNIYILFPSFVEQCAIASYFTTLDRQITLQSQRLEKLKQIKAACLDNMFV